MSKRLTAAEINSYRNDGVFFPIPVLTAEETADFRTAVEDLESCFNGQAKPYQISQCHLHWKWARQLATHPQILDIVEDIIGPDILVHATSIFNKRPQEGTYVSWHQDGYFLRLDEPSFVSVWVALTDSHTGNGCLRVVRKSHRQGIFAHTDSAVAEQNLLTSGLEIAVEVSESEATDVVLKAGEISLHDLNIVHGSNPNHSPDTRTGFAMRYVAPHVSQASAHHPVLLARGEDRHGHFQLHREPPYEDAAQALDAMLRFGAALSAQRQAAGRKG